MNLSNDIQCIHKGFAVLDKMTLDYFVLKKAERSRNQWIIGRGFD